MESKRRLTIIRVLVLAGVIALTIALFICREQVKKLEEFGYIGIFLISIFANATIIIPLPGVVITSAMGAIFDPFWVAVAAGLGASLGELTGYLAGFSGQAVIENAKLYARLTGWMQKYGALTILALAFIPNPAFDMAGMTAGALKMNPLKFLLFCSIGKILKMLLFAYFGSSLLKFF